MSVGISADGAWDLAGGEGWIVVPDEIQEGPALSAQFPRFFGSGCGVRAIASAMRACVLFKYGPLANV